MAFGQRYPGEVTWLEQLLFRLGRPFRWLRGRTY